MKIQQTKIFPSSKPSLLSMKQQMDSLAGNQVTRLGMRVGLTVLGLSVLVFSVSFTKLPPEVPLFFSRPYGEERLVFGWVLGLLPLISLIIQSISMRFAGSVIEEDELLAQLLVGTGTLVSLMCFFALVKIVLLVT